MRAIAVGLLVASVWVGSASAAVDVIRFSKTVRPGGWGAVVLRTPSASRCTIRVVYPDTTVEMSSRGVHHSWRWSIHRRRSPGAYPVRIACDGQGKVSLVMRVRR